MSAKRSCQHHPVHSNSPELIHQKLKAGMKGSFGQLDSPDIILNDRDMLTQPVGEGSAIFLNP